MSYLDPPRLTFVGKFFANVPTLNNFPAYFNPDYPFFGGNAGDWNDNGDCSFQFREGWVRGVTDKNGVNSTDTNVDPVIGAAVTTDLMGPSAIPGTLGVGKIVDLDVNQRRVTQLHGVQISIVLSDDVWVSGLLQTCNMRDFWGPGGRIASAVFQSVLNELQWRGDVTRSPSLKQLHSIAAANGNQLSIKMILDNFSLNPSEPAENLVGRVVGVIGPYYMGEPRQFVAERRLTKTYCSPPSLPAFTPPQPPPPAPAVPPAQVDGTMFWPAPCRVDRLRKKLIVDLGNSVEFAADKGEAVISTMWAAIMPSEAEYQTGQLQPNLLSPPIDSSLHGYETTGRIGEMDLSDEDLARLVDHRICLLAPDAPPDDSTADAPPVSPQNPWPVLTEERDARFVDLDNWVLRLNPGESGSVELYARRFGQPFANQRLMFSPIDYPCTWVTINHPLDALEQEFPLFVTTDANGKALITITVRPGPIQGLPPARIPVFSQVYQLGDVSGWQAWGQVGPPVPPFMLASGDLPLDFKAAILSVLVFNEGPPIPNPTWDDVKPMFSHYARMFPAMKEMIDLSSEQMVRAYAARIYDVLQRPLSDPYHMPATRDLSAYHRRLMLDFLRPLLPSGTTPPPPTPVLA